MASMASKTRPPIAGVTSHRSVNSPSGSKTVPGGHKASGNGPTSSAGMTATPGTIKKIKLSQKAGSSGFGGGSNSPMMPNNIQRKPTTVTLNVKNHVVGSVNSTMSGVPSNSTNIPEDIFFRTAKRPNLANYHFAESSAEILEKYKDHPASIEFHIHPTHYRFGNQDAIIPKNSPLIKSFLELVELEQIPPAALEVFREAGIRYYEGCIILQIFDYRGGQQQGSLLNSVSPTKSSAPASGSNNTISEATRRKSSSQLSVGIMPSKDATERQTMSGKTLPGMLHNSLGSSQDSSLISTSNNNSNSNIKSQALDLQKAPDGSEVKPKLEGSQQLQEPNTYRILLRPTPLTLWYDLCLFSDSPRYTDSLAMALESEILAATVPNLDLSVPESSPMVSLPEPLDLVPPESFAVRNEYGSLHAPDLPSGRKRKRPLHEDLPHQGTKYEEMMLIMDEKPPDGTGQFLRLGFVEQWRRKRERERIQRMNESSQNGNVSTGRR
ncbi:Spt20 family-domain-containing protein [Dipodascopsis uninucleata]